MSTSYQYTQTEDSVDQGYNSGFNTASDGITITSANRNTQQRGSRRGDGHAEVAVAMTNLRKKCLTLKKYATYKKINLPSDVL
ncbi:unnamed protein product, partial [marine sediment metagenome]